MYYVVSGGFHPFGDDLRHQANIASGDYNLSALQTDGQYSENLGPQLFAINFFKCGLL